MVYFLGLQVKKLEPRRAQRTRREEWEPTEGHRYTQIGKEVEPPRTVRGAPETLRGFLQVPPRTRR
jgi:hypothetical protein